MHLLISVLNEEANMNTVVTHFLSTIQELFEGRSSAEPSELLDIDAIRRAMLDSLSEEGRTLFPQIARRVMFAANLLALWYVRPELMMALSSKHGESIAQERVEQITAMFDGLLPQAMRSSRSAGLGR
jgi:hypothetical protein